jgi:hypothetical protein
MSLTITIRDTIAIATMGEGWAGPTEVAETLASQLEEAYFNAAIQLYPEAMVEADVSCAAETLGEGLNVTLENSESDKDFDAEDTEQTLLAALKDLKGQMGEAFLTNYEDEEESDDKAELAE